MEKPAVRLLSPKLRTPMAWKCLADSYEQNKIHEMFHLEGSDTQSSSVAYSLLEHYVTLVLTGGTASAEGAVRRLGKLALKLIKSNRNTFSAEEQGLPPEYLLGSVATLFERRERRWAFAHANYQVLLAGMYVGQFWTEAEAELKDDDAKSLSFTAVYDCAMKHIPPAHLPSLQNRFRDLSARLSASIDERSRSKT